MADLSEVYGGRGMGAVRSALAVRVGHVCDMLILFSIIVSFLHGYLRGWVGVGRRFVKV
jgi:hypothetical protein